MNAQDLVTQIPLGRMGFKHIGLLICCCCYLDDFVVVLVVLVEILVLVVLVVLVVLILVVFISLSFQTTIFSLLPFYRLFSFIG